MDSVMKRAIRRNYILSKLLAVHEEAAAFAAVTKCKCLGLVRGDRGVDALLVPVHVVEQLAQIVHGLFDMSSWCLNIKRMSLVRLTMLTA